MLTIKVMTGTEFERDEIVLGDGNGWTDALQYLTRFGLSSPTHVFVRKAGEGSYYVQWLSHGGPGATSTHNRSVTVNFVTTALLTFRNRLSKKQIVPASQPEPWYPVYSGFLPEYISHGSVRLAYTPSEAGYDVLAVFRTLTRRLTTLHGVNTVLAFNGNKAGGKIMFLTNSAGGIELHCIRQRNGFFVSHHRAPLTLKPIKHAFAGLYKREPGICLVHMDETVTNIGCNVDSAMIESAETKTPLVLKMLRS